ncbi:hypothetical protein SK128_014047 [Halocaridina rubra]|uniref:PFL domain-containing protein n=1 Tax=Halocaridina rubra TaxID=373956 RepID=A0AAN9FW76_HALRR
MSTEAEIQHSEDPSPIDKAQIGLFDFRHNYGKFMNIILKAKNKEIKDEILKVVNTLVERASSMTGRSHVLVAFNPMLWNAWGCNVPLEQRPDSNYLTQNSEKFISTPGDIFFYIKSDVLENADKLLSLLNDELASTPNIPIKVISTTESVQHGNTKIIGGLFREGLANFSDPVTVNEHILINDNKNGMTGGTYMMTQKFEINWEVLGSKTTTQKEDMIGRRVHTNVVIPTSYERSHIKRAHFVDDFPPPCNILKGFRRVFRQSLPYGKSDSGNGREKGLFYLSITRSTKIFVEILEHLAGVQANSPHGEITFDELISAFVPIEGTFWYIPSKEELEVRVKGTCKVDLDPHWDVRSKNGLMFYNQKDYMHTMTCGSYTENDAPSARVLRLLSYAFEQWNHNWFKAQTPPDMPSLQDVLTPDEVSIAKASIPIRKAMAIKKTLGEVYTTSDMTRDPAEFYGWKADLFNIHPDEIIVGRMPRFSLGLGRVVMPYLTESERLGAFLAGLSEDAGVGHVTPQHKKVLKLGLDGLIDDVHERAKKRGVNAKQNEFYKSVIISLEGVQIYMENYSKLAEHLSSLTSEYSKQQRQNLKEISHRMHKLAHKPAETLVEAVQMVFTMHSCLHLTGEPVAVGRFDQYLHPYENTCSTKEAQEIIDCFWIKLSERVLLNRHFVVDQTKWGSCAVPYATNGLFPNGDSINQWVQQLTVGGYQATDDIEPIPGSNKITLYSLKAARRLPLNAPCLSLRLHDGMSADIIVEAAKALLSGGAHPILPQDDRICPALLENGSHLKKEMSISESRDYACDGCYEPLIDGKSEFAFAYVPLPQIIEMSMNQGSLHAQSGPNYLRGTAASFTTAHPNDIKTFDDFKEIFAKHLRIQIERNMYGVMINYGNIWKYCPTPLLSAVVGGCLKTGRDHYNGGAKYHILSCMFVGFSTCVDSLYAIKKMCYDQATATVSLHQLLECMKCDWGFQMQEPFVDDIAGPVRTKEKKDFFAILRKQAFDLEKFGTEAGAENEELQGIVAWLSDLIIASFNSVVYNEDDTAPLPSLIKDLRQRYSVPGAPFDFLFTPGSGTFEGYVGWGLACGASPDGRREGMPIASDFSAAPTPQDLEPCPPHDNVFKALKNWDHPAINKGFSCGAEIDLNISEDFPLESLVRLIYSFSKQQEQIGGNLLTGKLNTYPKIFWERSIINDFIPYPKEYVNSYRANFHPKPVTMQVEAHIRFIPEDLRINIHHSL